MVEGNRIGVSLSGGGYRAAAFHLGTLKKLHELGILQKTDVISTISGGSILGAFYCVFDSEFEAFEEEMVKALNTKSVIKYILFSPTTGIAFLSILAVSGIISFVCQFLGSWASIFPIILFGWLFAKFQFKILPISKEIERAYDNFFYKKARLSSLRDKPELAIGATNLQTCRPFTFSKRKMDDSAYAYSNPPVKFKNEDFPLAKAVAASTCVPNFFTPITIEKKYFVNAKDYDRIRPVLVDGGVYDNQGIQKLTQSKSSYECDIIITSDAGNRLPFNGTYNNTFNLLLRTIETFMVRIKNFQMVENVYHKSSGKDEIAYFSLGWELKKIIPGFISNLKSGNIPESVVALHGVPVEYLLDIDTYMDKIKGMLERSCGYEKIARNDLTQEEAMIAAGVSTNLMTLSRKQIAALMKHAENLTELQTRLYCPSLFK